MSSERIFVGRRDELKLWDDLLADPAGQAVLVVGQQGMGKTLLVDKMAECALDRPGLVCGSVRYDVARTDPPDTTMQWILDDAFEVARSKAASFDNTSQRHKQWAALFRALVPKGKELLELARSLRYDPQRPIRQQLIQRLHLISQRMPKHGRAIFVIDPESCLVEGIADAWQIVVRELPPKIKFLFAQRHYDQLVTSDKFSCLPNVRRIPSGHLDVLDEEAAERLLEIYAPKLAYPPAVVRGRLAAYNRHPYALPAALAMLAGGLLIENLPQDPTTEKVAKAQWELVCDKGEDAIRLFCAYAILEVPVPDEVANEVAQLDFAKRKKLDADDYLCGLLRLESDGRRIYHSLLADHIRGNVPADDAAALHRRAIETYRHRLRQHDKPDAIAAVRLPEHVLAVEGEEAFAVCVVDACFGPLRILGLLGAALAFLERALAVSSQDRAAHAAILGNLGVIYQTRGDLDRAEEMLRKALAIYEKSGWQDGVARQYCNLGLIYLDRGDLERAEEMLRKALAIEEKLGRQEGMAANYGNLGLIYKTRGDLDRAEKMLRKALAIEEKLGRQEGMANACGSLGVIYLTGGDLERAEEMHRKGLAIDEKLGRQEGMAKHYGSLGLIYLNRGDLERAEEMLRKALAIDEKLGRQEGVAKQFGNLGLIYLNRGDLECAEEMLRKALALNEKLGRQEGVANQYGNLGAIFATRGDFPRAREDWTRARELFRKIGMPHMVKHMDDWLASLPPAAGDGQGA